MTFTVVGLQNLCIGENVKTDVENSILKPVLGENCDGNELEFTYFVHS